MPINNEQDTLNPLKVTALLALHQQLKYPKEEGLCHGFSLRWLEAALLGRLELERFENRIKYILSTPTDLLIQQINKTLAKNGQNLTSNDYELIEILAFFDSLSLYQTPENYPSLFNNLGYINQEQFEVVSAYASSVEIEKAGGLKEVGLDLLIATTDEIEIYLHELKQFLDKNLDDYKEPIGFLLSDDEHTVALAYDPVQEKFTYRDIKNLEDNLDSPDIAASIDSTDAEANMDKADLEGSVTGLSNADPGDESDDFDSNDDIDDIEEDYEKNIAFVTSDIVYSFKKKKNIDSESHYTAFSIQLIVTGNDKRYEMLQERFKQFKLKRPLTKEIASRETETINLSFFAALYNLGDYIEKLGAWQVNLDKINGNGFAPAYVAAEFGSCNAIEQLGKFKANLNFQTEDGLTPAYIASDNGFVEVIKILAKFNASLNIATKKGITPIFTAAQHGHANVVKELILHKVNVKEPCVVNKVYLQSLIKDKEPMVEECLTKFLTEQLNNDKISITPYDIAMIMGHHEVVAVIDEMVTQKVENKFDSRVADTRHSLFASQPEKRALDEEQQLPEAKLQKKD
ncbi:ankyrin repeat domain-containing protein [Legionella sp. D16C41]|uniref:ankyrin repeat domain-containing protein n=1 Tax=Legionella sp. D16C41 TaxID=3402688 RepID=UPI003AF8838C